MHKSIFVSIIAFILAATAVWFFFNRNPASVTEQTATTATTTLGFIRSIEGQRINFDDALWLSGKEGEDAAIAAGICTEATRNECLPNDFFIQNTSTSTVSMETKTDVQVVMQTLRMETEGVHATEITFEEFTKLINDASVHWNNLPYTITVSNGVVTKIEEVYIP